MKCFIDGTALCVVGYDFINLQESDAVFIDVDAKTRERLYRLEESAIYYPASYYVEIADKLEDCVFRRFEDEVE